MRYKDYLGNTPAPVESSMTVPMRRIESEELTHLLEWIFEKVGLYDPPKADPAQREQNTVTIVDSPAINPEVREWLKQTTGNDYVSAMAGFECDGAIGLVRNDSAIDDLQKDGDSFRLCTEYGPGSIVNSGAAQPAFSCTYFSIPEEISSQLIKFDEPPLCRHSVEISSGRSGAMSAEKAASLYFTLSPDVRDSVSGMNAGGLPSDAWRLSSMGIVRVESSSEDASFFEDAARAMTVKLSLAGIPVLDRWNALCSEGGGEDGTSAADKIAEMVANIYKKPEAVRTAIASNAVTANRARLLAELGYLREDQKKYLFSLEGENKSNAMDPEKMRCASATLR